MRSTYTDSIQTELRIYVRSINPAFCHFGAYDQDSSKQALILGTPGGLVGALATLVLGWYADKRVNSNIFYTYLTRESDERSTE